MISIRQVQTGDRNMNQLQENIRQPVEAVFNESVGSFTANLSGMTQPISFLATWQTGTTQNAVTMRFPGITGTSNSTDMVLNGLPTNLWPQTTQTVFYRVVDSGAASVGLAIVNTDGTITFFKDVSAGVFTASGTKGLASYTFSYIRGI